MELINSADLEEIKNFTLLWKFLKEQFFKIVFQ